MNDIRKEKLEEAKEHFEYMLNEGGILLSMQSRDNIKGKLKLINAELEGEDNG